MRTDESVTQMGLDIHRKFSKVTARDEQGKIVWRQRLEHADRPRMRERLARWPSGAPVVLEATFGGGGMGRGQGYAAWWMAQAGECTFVWDELDRLSAHNISRHV